MHWGQRREQDWSDLEGELDEAGRERYIAIKNESIPRRVKGLVVMVEL